MNPTTLDILGGIAASIASILGVWLLIAKLISPLVQRTRKLLNTLESFIDDWSGTPEGPGRSRIPGVMERINEIDGALKNNGGSSVKDAVDRIEKKLTDMEKRLEEGDEKFSHIIKNIYKIEDEIDIPHDNI